MTDEGPTAKSVGSQARCADAVMIIPGIMGSELRDASGKLLWGFDDLSWYHRAWTTGQGLRELRLTSDERNGRYGRVRASRLIRFPAFARVLSGVEPYTRLVEKVRMAAVHPEAVQTFPYDWRLPVAHNARLLAERIGSHYDAWLGHEAYIQHCRSNPDLRPAQVVLVAHSMGGLLAWYLSLIPGATKNVRTTITLGTPFFGSVKAAIMISSGRGSPIPLPRYRPLAMTFSPKADEGLRRLAQSLPGLHDLLPTFRCLDEGQTARRLTPSDVAALGGNFDFADASLALHEKLRTVSPAGHRAVVGVAQETFQSLSLDSGQITPLWTECQVDTDGSIVRRVDRRGDGTVHRDAANLPDQDPSYLPHQHGSLARSNEAVHEVIAILTERVHRGPYLGDGDLGLDAPDVVPGLSWQSTITGAAAAGDVQCYVRHLETGIRYQARMSCADGLVQAHCRVDLPGLCRLEAIGSGMSPVSQLVLVSGQ